MPQLKTADVGGPILSVKVLGLGLVGGSLAKLFLQRGRAVLAWDVDDDTRRLAIAAGVPVPASWEAFLSAPADVTFVATPIDVLPEAFAALAATDEDSSLVCDVASVKVAPETWANAAGLSGRYVGLHPMAGAAQSGFAFSTAELYRGVPWIVVPNPQATEAVRDVITLLCRETQARVLVADARRHDASAALVSHVPHVMANALLCEVGESEVARLAFAMSAGSFRDMTRVAGTEPTRTGNMLVWNRTEVVQGIADLVSRLQELSRELSEGDQSLPFLLEAQRIRNGLEAATPPERLTVAEEDVSGRLLELASQGRPIVGLHVEQDGWVIEVE